ncbi:MAG: cysteine desulfurase family protein [Thermodesulfobacteriota bacterium]
MQRSYFDNNATTPLDPEVLAAMLPYLAEQFGNPSSNHRFGEVARSGVEQARQQVARLVNCPPRQVIFTGGGTEANNMAVASGAAASGKRHLITSTVEHPSVLAPLRHLAGHGFELTVLEVDDDGGLPPSRLAAAIRPDTALVSLMAANNESGVIWPVEEYGALCRQRGVLFHTDAIQYAGKMAIDMQRLPVDYLTVAAHKLHGPKGCGALCFARTAPVVPVLRGAGQEFGLRPGTENVAAIAGFGIAAELAARQLDDFAAQTGSLRDLLENEVAGRLAGVRINGRGQMRLPNTSNLSFSGVAGAALVQELDEQGFAVSAHSACHGGDLDPSHVLVAMRVPEEFIHGTLRISFSRNTRRAEVEGFIELLVRLVGKSRATAAL